MTGALYALAKWWVDVLPVDDAGRRCCDETLADWRKEAARVSGPISRFAVATRSVVSVIRCVAGVSLHEAASIYGSGVITRVVLWTLGYVALATIIGVLSSTAPDGVKLSGWSRACLTVSVVAYFLPVALMLATSVGRRLRTGSGLGLALAACLAGFLLFGWGVPAANRAFLKENPGRYTNPTTQAEREWRRPYNEGEGLAMGMNDLSLRQTVMKIVEGPQGYGWQAVRWMSFFAAYLVICAVTPLLAAVIQQRTGWIRYPIIVATVLVILGNGAIQSLGNEFSIVWWLGAYWIPVIWMTVCLIAVTWRSHQRTTLVQ